MARFPTLSDLRSYLAENPDHATTRDVARAFGLGKGDVKRLKPLLRDLRKEARAPGGLPPVGVLTVTEETRDGDLFAQPAKWAGEGDPPRLLLTAHAEGHAPAIGDRVLARTATAADGTLTASVIRRIGTGPARILGIFRDTAEGGRIIPIEKGVTREWQVRAGDGGGAKDGELVEAERSGPKSRLGLPRARVTSVLGDPGAAKSVSLIAIHAFGIPHDFSEAALAEAEAVQEPDLGARTDLREMPFVTIDPADARDRDDAVLAAPDDDPKNPGGHVLWIAIADVAHAVRPGSALDRTGRDRGNSTYFPDRVVPMLPERLSGDLCSLHEGVDRAVLALRVTIDAAGLKTGHAFHRAMIRSRASLAYEAVQAAIDGNPDAATSDLLEPVLKPLFDAYAALARARNAREPLDLDLPERRIVLDDAGHVTSVAFKDRLTAHRVIEDFMILANVCAAETLAAKRTPLLYRVHEEPPPEKMETLREIADSAGLTLAKGQVLTTRLLNRLLHDARNTDHSEAISISVLRSMMQAYYSPQNFGHFGLALRAYAHFTSPIRRYADLIVHRALIAAHGWGDDGLSDGDIEALEATATHISETERRSMAAERDTNDRYLAAFLADRTGSEFEGRITGVARFGAFVRLAETGAEGLIPVSTLGREYFAYDDRAQTLTGDATGLTLGLGVGVTVRLAEAVPVTGGLIFELVGVSGDPLPRRGTRPRKGPVRGRKAARAGHKARARSKAGRRARP